MACDKCRAKAMKIASIADGVISVAVEGADKDQLVVIGEGVDSANLTCSLRKKLCYATLLGVEEDSLLPHPIRWHSKASSLTSRSVY
ncbi:heavy metal-associated isoprenylated plant protein 47 [Quercus suber]|uniref:Heavy metal-associated isoprenylated plant protein 47 n=1 Tax=Quercus suber TaxID=58331 RepID=A0AAW0K552_QUESU